MHQGRGTEVFLLQSTTLVTQSSHKLPIWIHYPEHSRESDLF